VIDADDGYEAWYNQQKGELPLKAVIILCKIYCRVSNSKGDDSLELTGRVHLFRKSNSPGKVYFNK